MDSYPVLYDNNGRAIRPSYDYGMPQEDNQVKSDKSAGYQHKRDRFTRVRSTFALPYPMLPQRSLYILRAHRLSVGSGSFYYYSFEEAYGSCIWQPLTVYLKGDIVCLPTPNGRSYIATVGGTSGSGQPAWTTTENATFTDGSGGTQITWQENAYTVTYGAPFKPKYVKWGYWDMTVGLDQV